MSSDTNIMPNHHMYSY